VSSRLPRELGLARSARGTTRIMTGYSLSNETPRVKRHSRHRNSAKAANCLRLSTHAIRGHSTYHCCLRALTLASLALLQFLLLSSLCHWTRRAVGQSSCARYRMPFPFSYVCDLLQRIEENLKARSGQRNNAAIVAEWFDQHRGRFKPDACDGAALLSTLLPHKRSDRVYFMQAAKLERHIGRALGLGRSRIRELLRYRAPGSGVDLADCVEEILTVTVRSIVSRGDV
jgi:hypothetical protein